MESVLEDQIKEEIEIKEEELPLFGEPYEYQTDETPIGFHHDEKETTDYDAARGGSLKHSSDTILHSAKRLKLAVEQIEEEATVYKLKNTESAKTTLKTYSKHNPIMPYGISYPSDSIAHTSTHVLTSMQRPVYVTSTAAARMTKISSVSSNENRNGGLNKVNPNLIPETTAVTLYPFGQSTVLPSLASSSATDRPWNQTGVIFLLSGQKITTLPVGGNTLHYIKPEVTISEINNKNSLESSIPIAKLEALTTGLIQRGNTVKTTPSPSICLKAQPNCKLGNQSNSWTAPVSNSYVQPLTPGQRNNQDNAVTAALSVSDVLSQACQKEYQTNKSTSLVSVSDVLSQATCQQEYQANKSTSQVSVSDVLPQEVCQKECQTNKGTFQVSISDLLPQAACQKECQTNKSTSQVSVPKVLPKAACQREYQQRTAVVSESYSQPVTDNRIERNPILFHAPSVKPAIIFPQTHAVGLFPVTSSASTQSENTVSSNLTRVLSVSDALSQACQKECQTNKSTFKVSVLDVLPQAACQKECQTNKSTFKVSVLDVLPQAACQKECQTNKSTSQVSVPKVLPKAACQRECQTNKSTSQVSVRKVLPKAACQKECQTNKSTSQVSVPKVLPKAACQKECQTNKSTSQMSVPKVLPKAACQKECQTNKSTSQVSVPKVLPKAACQKEWQTNKSTSQVSVPKVLPKAACQREYQQRTVVVSDSYSQPVTDNRIERKPILFLASSDKPAIIIPQRHAVGLFPVTSSTSTQSENTVSSNLTRVLSVSDALSQACQKECQTNKSTFKVSVLDVLPQAACQKECQTNKSISQVSVPKVLPKAACQKECQTNKSTSQVSVPKVLPKAACQREYQQRTVVVSDSYSQPVTDNRIERKPILFLASSDKPAIIIPQTHAVGVCPVTSSTSTQSENTVSSNLTTVLSVSDVLSQACQNEYQTKKSTSLVSVSDVLSQATCQQKYQANKSTSQVSVSDVLPQAACQKECQTNKSTFQVSIPKVLPKAACQREYQQRTAVVSESYPQPVTDNHIERKPILFLASSDKPAIIIPQTHAVGVCPVTSSTSTQSENTVSSNLTTVQCKQIMPPPSLQFKNSLKLGESDLVFVRRNKEKPDCDITTQTESDLLHLSEKKNLCKKYVTKIKNSEADDANNSRICGFTVNEFVLPDLIETKYVLHYHAKQLVARLYKYFTLENLGCHTPDAIERVGQALGMTQGTVARIVSDETLTTKQYYRPVSVSLSTSHQRFGKYGKSLLKHLVLKSLVSQIMPTTKSILELLQRNYAYGGTSSDIDYILKTLNFCVGTVNLKDFIFEKKESIWQRVNFLRAIKKYREAGNSASIIYVDEISLTQNAHCSLLENIKLPHCPNGVISLGFAGSANGFVSSAFIVKSDNPLDHAYDCSESLKREFKIWFEDELLPDLPPSSVIVLDTSPIHSKLFKTLVTSSTNKKQKMNDDNVTYEHDQCKQELLHVIKYCICYNSVSDTAKLATGMGHTVSGAAKQATGMSHTILRMPQFHSQFNPASAIGCHIKNCLAERSCNVTDTEGIKEIIESCYDQITTAHWVEVVKRSHELQDQALLNENNISKFYDSFTV